MNLIKKSLFFLFGIVALLFNFILRNKNETKKEISNMSTDIKWSILRKP